MTVGVSLEDESSRIMRASCLPLVLALVALPAFQAGAQNLPWPSNPPTGSAGSPTAMTPAPMSPAMSPDPMSPAPMSPAPMSPAMGGPMGGGFGGGGGGGPPPCVAEFGKLREE